MRMEKKTLKGVIKWASTNFLRKQAMLDLLEQFEEEELRRQKSIQEFNTNFNDVRKALEDK